MAGQGLPQHVNDRGERLDVIGQFLARVAQGLHFGLGGRIADSQAANLAVRVAEDDRAGPRRRAGLLSGNRP